MVNRLSVIVVAIAIVIVTYLYQNFDCVYCFLPTDELESRVLATVEDALVTSTNPARNGGALDHERCAILHNYLVEYGWTASGRSLDDSARRSFFDVYPDQPDAGDTILRRLHGSVVLFLRSITMADETSVPFFFWVSGVTPRCSCFSGTKMAGS
jgi:hypothetical protein